MKRIGILTALAVTILALTLPANSATCSNATLKGVYGYQDTQWDPTVKYYIVGIMKFDGTGNGRVGWAVRGDDGTVAIDPVGLTLTYAVAPDCTFTLTHETGLTLSGVIVDNAKELRYVETTGWQFRTGQAVKVTVSTTNMQ